MSGSAKIRKTGAIVMAVGYHKLNTSSARSKNRNGLRDDGRKITVHPRGIRFSHPIYGDVVTLSEFVSDRDNVNCASTSGDIILSGGFIREWSAIWKDKMGVTDD